MNKEKIRKKTYLTRRVKEQVILSKEGKVLSPTQISKITPKIFLRTIIKEQILKIHNIILQQQRTNIYLIIMVKLMNKETCEMLGISETSLCEGLSKLNEEFQQCAYNSRGSKCW